MFLISVLSPNALLPTKSTCLIFTFGPSSIVEGDVDLLRPAGRLGDLVADLRRLEALRLHHVAHDPFDLADQTGIDEGVEANGRVRFLELVFDLRPFDGLRTDVLDVACTRWRSSRL